MLRQAIYILVQNVKIVNVLHGRVKRGVQMKELQHLLNVQYVNLLLNLVEIIYLFI